MNPFVKALNNSPGYQALIVLSKAPRDEYMPVGGEQPADMFIERTPPAS
jgi:hypothetical protein